MDDPKNEKIEVERLMLGMYVTELDRPWIGTPFMLQGFLLDEQADIDTIMSLCKFVYIDRTKSVGNQFSAPIKQSVAIKREGAVVRLKDPGRDKSDKKTGKTIQHPLSSKTSFIDILRELKSYQAPRNIEHNSQDGTVYNIKYGANTAEQVAFPYQAKTNPQQKSIPKQLADDVGGFFGGLFKRNKLKSTIDNTTNANNTKNNLNDRYTVTIYEEEPPVENEIAVI